MIAAEQVETQSAGQSSLAGSALKGTVWIVIAYGAGQVFRLLTSIVLSRMLVPRYFGLMALVNTLAIGISLFADFGLNPSVIRSTHGDEPHYLNTVWTVQILRGIGLWLVSIALSWPIARFYGNPSLTAIVSVLGFNFVIDGFCSTSLITLARHMEIRTLAILEFGMQVVHLIVAVLFAMVSASVWALVIARLVSTLMRMIVSYFVIPGHRNRFEFDRDTSRDLISFGKWVFASTAVTFLASQSDRLVLGKLVSMATLGMYGIAFALADIPRQIILAFSGRIAFPFVSRFTQLKRDEFRTVVLRYRRIVLAAGAVLLALGVNFSDIFLLHVYDKRYHDAAWMAPVLALGLWHTILYSTTGPCLTAIGKLQYNISGYVLTSAVMLLAVPASFHFHGLVGAIWVIAFSDLPVYLSNLYGLWRENLLMVRQDVAMTILFAVCVGSLFLLRLGLGFPWPHSISLK